MIVKRAVRLKRTARKICKVRYLIILGLVLLYVHTMNRSQCKLGFEKDYISFTNKENRRLWQNSNESPSVTPEQAPERRTVAPEKMNQCLATDDDPLFPLCKKKFKGFKQQWNEKCHGEKHNVNISDPCSILIYLSEIEPWCPPLPWRQDSTKTPPTANPTFAHIQSNITGLEEILHQPWMRMRIRSFWSEWVEAYRELESKASMKTRRRQSIVIFLGCIILNPYIDKDAFHGGPLGELIQWSDVISSLYILGHDLTISVDVKDVIEGRLFTKHDKGCGVKNVKHVDRILSDICGDILMDIHLGPTLQNYRCKMLLLDSFGTDAELNYADYNQPIKRSEWGNRNLPLRQFMTMYPHSPDNLFMGFAIPKMPKRSKFNQAVGKPKGVIYAKLPEYLEGKRKYLDILSKYIELHGTMGKKEDHNQIIPEYVINHGVLNGSQLFELLGESKVFIGLGFPFEGPGPLDAIANGCFYINPKYTPPINRENHGFFRGKPTFRKLTSQNPFTEEFIGKPFVHTIDINDETEVENAIKEILASKETPYLPYQFSVQGMLERVNVFMEHLDFCTSGYQWPPKSEMKILKGQMGESCKNVCFDKGFLCEPSFFSFLNDANMLRRLGLRCKYQIRKESIYAPAYNSSNHKCILQEMPLLYSCVARDDHVTRICPCRTYQREQVALYKDYTG